MIVHFRGARIKLAAWHEYLIRFALGGTVTAAAGVLSDKIGPSFGGLFLAFPAILAASSSLVAKHERARKQSKGLNGYRSGSQAAAADAAGACVGSLGLMVFALSLEASTGSRRGRHAGPCDVRLGQRFNCALAGVEASASPPNPASPGRSCGRRRLKKAGTY